MSNVEKRREEVGVVGPREGALAPIVRLDQSDAGAVIALNDDNSVVPQRWWNGGNEGVDFPVSAPNLLEIQRVRIARVSRVFVCPRPSTSSRSRR